MLFFFSVMPVMIAVSVCAGVAEAIIWPCLSLLCVQLAGRFSDFTGKGKEIYVAKMFGQFYSVMFSTIVSISTFLITIYFLK